MSTESLLNDGPWNAHTRFEVWRDGKCIAEVENTDAEKAMEELKFEALTRTMEGPVDIIVVERSRIAIVDTASKPHPLHKLLRRV